MKKFVSYAVFAVLCGSFSAQAMVVIEIGDQPSIKEQLMSFLGLGTEQETSTMNQETRQYEFREDLAGQTITGEISSITCKSGIEGGLSSVKLKRNDKEIVIDDASCIKILPQVGNCSNRVTDFVVDNQGRLTNASAVRQSPGLTICM